MDEIIDSVFQELREKGSQSDRTIIYMPLKWCGYVHHRACTEYGQEDILMGVPVALDHAYSAASAPSAGGDVAQELSQMRLDDSAPGAGGDKGGDGLYANFTGSVATMTAPQHEEVSTLQNIINSQQSHLKQSKQKLMNSCIYTQNTAHQISL